jgi:hypothetical protein
MVSIKKLTAAIARYDAGDHSAKDECLIFRAVDQTLTKEQSDDIAELEDLAEAVRYLRVRLAHDHYRN